MKTDLYTKIVLTIIAVALTVNLLKGSATPAQADGRHYVSVPLNADGSLNVTIKNTQDVMKVSISDIAPYAFRNVTPLEVKVRN